MPRNLSSFFEPKRVVIIGASSTPGKPGHELIKNIDQNNYRGELYLVNPKGGRILGHPVFESVDQLPVDIDLAILIVPANKCPDILRESCKMGIENYVLLAGGFAEVDEIGMQLQQELKELIKKNNLNVLGPNTSGHISTPEYFTSSFFPLGKIRKGDVSYIAQTGNFATHTMKHILSSEYFGVSRVVGLGNKIDIDECDALEYLGDDDQTSSVIMYLESIMRPRRFWETARRITRTKPVVMLKSGQTDAGKNAAVAHTAALAENDLLVDSMLKQAGVVRIEDYSDLVLAGKALSMLPIPKGNRIGFLAPSGAMLVVLSDLCVKLGLEVPTLSTVTREKLEELSPNYLIMRNPVDIWGAATVKGVEVAYREGMKFLLEDPNIDVVIPVLMLTREIGAPSYQFILDLKKKFPSKPILVTYSGEEALMRDCKEFLEPRGVPTFSRLEDPFRAISILNRCRLAIDKELQRG